MASVKLPYLKFNAPFETAEVINTIKDYDNSQINPSCLLSYLGIRGIGVNMTENPVAERRFNAIPLLSYWDIYKNYYANKQEEIGAAIDLQITSVQNNVNAINVNAASLPQTGVDAEAIPLNATTYIDLIRDTGMPQDEMQIAIVTDSGKITLSTIGRRENTEPNVVRFWYDSARWGNRQAISWEYQTPTAELEEYKLIHFLYQILKV